MTILSLSFLVIAARTEMLAATYEPPTTFERVGGGCFLSPANIAESGCRCRFGVCIFVIHFFNPSFVNLIECFNL